MLAYIVIGWFVLHGGLDAISQEAEDGSNPQQDGETPKKLATELDPFRSGRGWSEGVGSIPSQYVLSPLVGEALGEEGEAWRQASVPHWVLRTPQQLFG